MGRRALERRGRETLGSLEQRKRPTVCEPTASVAWAGTAQYSGCPDGKPDGIAPRDKLKPQAYHGRTVANRGWPVLRDCRCLMPVPTPSEAIKAAGSSHYFLVDAEDAG